MAASLCAAQPLARILLPTRHHRKMGVGGAVMTTEISPPIMFPILKSGRQGSQKPAPASRPPGIILFKSHAQSPSPLTVPVSRGGNEKSVRTHCGGFCPSEMPTLMGMRTHAEPWGVSVTTDEAVKGAACLVLRGARSPVEGALALLRFGCHLKHPRVSSSRYSFKAFMPG